MVPDFSIESSINGDVYGLDEVGRGPLAGPVVAGCVYIPLEKRTLDFVSSIRDSKTLSEKKLHALDDQIRAHFIWGIGECSPQEIDNINILQASFLAMERAFLNMKEAPSPQWGEGWGEGDKITALIDGHILPKSFPCPARAIKKGDSLSISIAAASIIAKVARDKIMSDLAQMHPYYGWERNAGYPTAEHIAALNLHGVTDHHRRSFGPVQEALSL
jgi:ribonuclease HII